jgi:putative transposase
MNVRPARFGRERRISGSKLRDSIIERYRRRESSAEEALIEMYLAGVSVHPVEDITSTVVGV